MQYPHTAKSIAWPSTSAALRYGLAFLSVAAAFGLAQVFLYFNLPQPFTAFALSAIAITFWYGGTGPGVLASVFSSLVRGDFFEPEISSQSRILYAIAFLVFALVMTLVMRGRRELELRVAERTAELTKANDGLKLEIAKRERSEEVLRRSEAHLNEGQRLSQTGSFNWNVSTGELYWSDETFRIFGYDTTTTTHPGMVLERIHPEDVALVRATTDRAAADGGSFSLEHRLLMPDGSIKHARLVAHVAASPQGQLEFFGAVMDITAAKRAEEDLHKSQADLAHVTRVTTLGELTASIAHEVNQPLGALVANAEACLHWLAHDKPNLAEARRNLNMIIRDGQRAGEVVRRVRALAKKSEPQKLPLDLNGIVKEVIALVRREMTRQGVILRTDLAATVHVLADRIQLQQVLINLIMNGIEAMQPIMDRPRELEIRSYQDDKGEVVLAVKDCGIGLPAEVADRLFNAFFTTKSDGLGMGLSICHSIIEAHGGRLSCARNPGPGATFQFALPPCEHAVGR